jgi:methyltransferase (TIGR00027 family)
VTDSPASGSVTALGVAALRAAHLLLDDPPPILTDTVALRLLGPGAEVTIREHADRYRHPRSLALRSHVVLRNRWAEDLLADAMARGTRQYAILGAGLDTFAHRQPPAAHEAGLRIFEVDLPATQAAKRRRLAGAGISDPPNLRYVEADLTAPDLLAKLTSAGFDPTRRSVAALLGVTVYLPPDDVRRLYATLAGLAPGSEVVMTFANRPLPGMPDGLAEAAANVGEPWLTRTTVEELERDLHAAGFGAVDIPDPWMTLAAYFKGRTDGLGPPRRPNLARATV